MSARLSGRDRELAETRREVNNVIEKKKRLEQVGRTWHATKSNSFGKCYFLAGT